MENKLPTEFKEKWVAALRSGEYEKCRFKLKDGVGYCCLGVALHITGGESTDDTVIEGEANKTKVPRLIMGNCMNNDIVETLTDMNDDINGTFFEIADYIEQNL